MENVPSDELACSVFWTAAYGWLGSTTKTAKCTEPYEKSFVILFLGGLFGLFFFWRFWSIFNLHGRMNIVLFLRAITDSVFSFKKLICKY